MAVVCITIVIAEVTADREELCLYILHGVCIF